jgi:phosphatidylcholine synthase
MTTSTAWAVHAYTASGALMGLAGIVAAAAGDLRMAFIWMFAATFVDGTDGLLARLARVKERTPLFDGARLDDIVDYLTFVFLPAFVIVTTSFVPAELRWPVAGAMLLSSAYGFASLDAKTSDNFFTGFPSYWNVVVLYVATLGLPPWANAALILAFAVMVFVRIGYIYPTRTPMLQRTTLALMAVWAVMLLLMILWYPSPPRWLVIGSLVFPVYYTVLSFALHARRPPPAAADPAGME